MKYHSTTGEDAVMVKPESVEEAGLFLWLAKRFQGKEVRFVFDTTMSNGVPHQPMLWLKPLDPKA